MGYLGQEESCGACGRTYKKALMKYTSWFHIYYIPLIPYKKTYFNMCPICGAGYDVDKNTAKSLIQAGGVGHPGFEVFAKHILANKQKGLFKADTSYELWVKDLATGEEICIEQNIEKERVNEVKRVRGLKKVPIIDIK